MNIRSLKTGVRNKSQNGSSLVEYALLVSLISVVTIGSVRSVGRGINCNLYNTGAALSSPVDNGARDTVVTAIMSCAELMASVEVEMIPGGNPRTVGTGGFSG